LARIALSLRMRRESGSVILDDGVKLLREGGDFVVG
jgi:hypothetical protein